MNAIAIYIADLECSKVKYPECPADNEKFTSLLEKSTSMES